MDYSKTYIEMCSAAEELQRGKECHYLGEIVILDDMVWTIGDYQLGEGGHSFCCVRGEDGEFLQKWVGENPNARQMTRHPLVTWLPRQDDLQRMIIRTNTQRKAIGSIIEPPFMTGKFFRLALSMDLYDCTSMEQHWFLLVMQIVYNKKYNPESKTFSIIESVNPTK